MLLLSQAVQSKSIWMRSGMRGIRVHRRQALALRAFGLAACALLASVSVALLARFLPSASEGPLLAASTTDGAATLADPDLSLALNAGGTPRARPQRGIHVVATCNGAPYVNWQVRIMYRTFIDTYRLPGSDMPFFTRILHRSSPDELITEIPTFRADPPTPQCDVRCDFPVSERSAAIRQWLRSPDSRRASHVFIAETDYVWNSPLGLPTTDNVARAHFFDYINPERLPAQTLKSLAPEIDPASIPRTGPAPTLLSRSQLSNVVPLWESLTNQIEHDDALRNRLGWLRDMYAFSVALRKAKIKPLLLTTEFMSQPPKDNESVTPIFHYTWKDEMQDPRQDHAIAWRFEKREFDRAEYVRKPHEYKPQLPPTDALHRGLVMPFPVHGPVTQGVLDAILVMLKRIHSAIDGLSSLPHPNCGWQKDEEPCPGVCEKGELCKRAVR